jgi:hypothetical protein
MKRPVRETHRRGEDGIVPLSVLRPVIRALNASITLSGPTRDRPNNRLVPARSVPQSLPHKPSAPEIGGAKSLCRLDGGHSIRTCKGLRPPVFKKEPPTPPTFR